MEAYSERAFFKFRHSDDLLLLRFKVVGMHNLGIKHLHLKFMTLLWQVNFSYRPKVVEQDFRDFETRMRRALQRAANVSPIRIQNIEVVTNAVTLLC